MNDPFSITGHTALTALLGSPVSHSLSPMMHNTAFQLLGLDYVYLCFDVPEDRLETAVSGLKACGIRGFNLTMPDKNKMAELCDELSPAARIIGAVNTVVNDNGHLTGHNTDGIGFLRSASEAGCPISGKTMTLLGAGGAASAIAAQAALDGLKNLHIFARTTSRFHDRTVCLVDLISKMTSCHVQLHDLSDPADLKKCLDATDLLVNATPVGMAPDTESSILEDISWFHPEMTVADIIYNPRKTRFLKLASAAGCPVFNGMYMLLHQGAEAFRIWTGREMPVEEIRRRFFV